MTKISLIWHGHSCFSIGCSGYSLILDPYKSEMIGYPPLCVKAHVMLSSHQHEDHNYLPAVDFQPAPNNLLQQLSLDDEWPGQNGGDIIFYYKILPTKHDDAGGRKRGDNSIHIIDVCGFRIAHMGDLGHMLNPQQQSYLRDLDMLLVPVGGYYTIDAKQAYETVLQLNPRNVVPMHFIGQYGDLNISTVDPFVRLIEHDFQIKQVDGYEVTYSGNTRNICYFFKKLKLHED